ncbi:hypothetical protein D3C72_699240 [compost metagenome]
MFVHVPLLTAHIKVALPTPVNVTVAVGEVVFEKLTAVTVASLDPTDQEPAPEAAIVNVPEHLL